MKAKKINENINFERGGNVREKIGIGWDARVQSLLKEIKYEIEYGIKEGWDAFLNTGEYQYEDDPHKLETWRYYADNWERYEDMLAEIGLGLEERPDREEAVFILTPIYETLNFERGRDPIQTLGLGYEGKLKKENKEIFWNWYPDSSDDMWPWKENIIEIINYYGNYIKISQTEGPNFKNTGKYYFTLDDDSVPSMDYENHDIPSLFRTPEEALERAIIFLGEYHGDHMKLGDTEVRTVSKRFDTWLKGNGDDVSNRDISEEPIWESISFERGKDPRDVMGLGLISQVPRILFNADNDSDYLTDYEPGPNIYRISTTPGRFFVEFHSGKFRKTGSKRPVSRLKYLEGLLEQTGLDRLFDRVYNDHHSAVNMFMTLKPEFKRPMKQGEIFIPENYINENINFERGIEPKEAMGIGRKELLKKIDSRTIWDWAPDPEDTEEIIDIVEYKGHQIKVSLLSDDKGSAYAAVPATGEPFAGDPPFFHDPETALKVMKLTIDDLSR